MRSSSAFTAERASSRQGWRMVVNDGESIVAYWTSLEACNRNCFRNSPLLDPYQQRCSLIIRTDDCIGLFKSKYFLNECFISGVAEVAECVSFLYSVTPYSLAASQRRKSVAKGKCGRGRKQMRRRLWDIRCGVSVIEAATQPVDCAERVISLPMGLRISVFPRPGTNKPMVPAWEVPAVSGEAS
jgi:hypothetical protein